MRDELAISRGEVLELISKAAITTATSAASQLSAQQSRTFIETVQAKNPLASRIRVEPRDSAAGSIEKIAFATGLIRAASENADDGYRAEPTFATVPYQAKAVRLPWETTLPFLRYNIEGQSVDQKIWNGFTQAFATDLTRLDLLGDTASGDASLSIDDGWLKLIAAGGSGAHRVNGSNASLGATWPNKKHLFAALDALPDKYKEADGNGNRPVWISSPTTKLDFVEYRTDRGTAAGDAALGGSDAATDRPLNYEWLEVPQMPNDRILLTPPQNLVRVMTTDIQRFRVGPETDWELATRRKVGRIFFLDRDAIVQEMDAVVDLYNLGT